jgi:hypothetical protein
MPNDGIHADRNRQAKVGFMPSGMRALRAERFMAADSLVSQFDAIFGKDV